MDRGRGQFDSPMRFIGIVKWFLFVFTRDDATDIIINGKD